MIFARERTQLLHVNDEAQQFETTKKSLEFQVVSKILCPPLAPEFHTNKKNHYSPNLSPILYLNGALTDEKNMFVPKRCGHHNPSGSEDHKKKQKNIEKPT